MSDSVLQDEAFEFLVGGKLLTHFRHKLRANELGGPATVGVAELVEGSMFLGSYRIHTLATRLLAGGVLLVERTGLHVANLGELGFKCFDLRPDLLGRSRGRDIV